MKRTPNHAQRFHQERTPPSEEAEIRRVSRTEGNERWNDLESFLVARWGRAVLQRPRADRTVRPWGAEPAPPHLSDFTWVVFGDEGQPRGVGIRAEKVRDEPMFLLIYWRDRNRIESHRWRLDPVAGWQYVRELDVARL